MELNSRSIRSRRFTARLRLMRTVRIRMCQSNSLWPKHEQLKECTHAGLRATAHAPHAASSVFRCMDRFFQAVVGKSRLRRYRALHTISGVAQDMMEDAAYVRRESCEIRQLATTAHAHIVAVPEFIDFSEILPGNILNGGDTKRIHLDQMGFDSMNCEVITQISIVSGPFPDLVSPLDHVIVPRPCHCPSRHWPS